LSVGVAPPLSFPGTPIFFFPRTRHRPICNIHSAFVIILARLSRVGSARVPHPRSLFGRRQVLFVLLAALSTDTRVSSKCVRLQSGQEGPSESVALLTGIPWAHDSVQSIAQHDYV